MTKLIFEYTKLLRLPGLGGLSLAPIFGALSVYGLDEIIDFKILTLLLILGIFKSIFGFVQNDYADIELDKLSEETKTRPLVTGTISKQIAVIICLICLIGTFFIVFAFFYRNDITFYIAVLLILVSLFIGSIYNYFGKKFSTSAFIAALADSFYVLIGAYLVSSIIELTIFTWIIFGLVYAQFLFMTIIAGGVKDADHDYLYNVKNFAIKCGVKITSSLSFSGSCRSFFGGIHSCWSPSPGGYEGQDHRQRLRSSPPRLGRGRQDSSRKRTRL